MNSIYKWVAILGLAACGQSWAAPRIDECNAALQVSQTKLQFGSFVAPLGGTITVDPATGATTATGVTMVANGLPGTITLSVPGVNGNCNMQLSILLPASYTLTNGSGQTMTVSQLTTSYVTGTTVSLRDGTPLVIYVGGTLTAAAGQAGGTYTGSYTITVNFI